MKKTQILFLLLLPYFAFSQNTNKIIENTLSKQGDWNSLNNYQYTLKRALYVDGQYYSTTEAKPLKAEAYFSKDISTNRFYNRTITNFPGGYRFDFIAIGKENQVFNYDYGKNRAGIAVTMSDKNTMLIQARQNITALPFYILTDLSKSTDTLISYENETEKSIVRKFKDGSETYLISKKEGFLQKIINKQGKRETVILFEEYQNKDNLWFPIHIKTFTNGSITSDEKVTNMKFNIKFPDDHFEVPKDYALTNTTNSPLQAKEIGKGIYLIEKVSNDRNVLFADMGDYILVTEAPVSTTVVKSILEVIQKTLPNKKIKVHISHFHTDHIAGIGAFTEANTTIICTQKIAERIKKFLNLKTDHSLTFELFENSKILNGDNKEIKLFNIANSHAEDLAFVYIPNESIIYESDFLSIPIDGTTTPAIAITKILDKYLKTNKIQFRRMIGHHGLSDITPEIFNEVLSKK
ncbi:MAG TPA: hypothetical protein VJL37_12880 [Flavobacterium sp.]|nr:hypothetical protein [Flavobacterium sp.]